ncbi:hypothetical protein ILUMI_15362, partial [Ignelater luminosus]
VFNKALDKLQQNETCSLYLNSAVIAVLPVKCSRHNTPSRCHTITRLVQNCSNNYQNKSVVIVCPFEDMFASGCAVARAFSLYNRKTGSRSEQSINVSIEFIILDVNTNLPQNNKEFNGNRNGLSALEYAAIGINLAARITDTPCNELNVDEFLQEIYNIGTLLKIKPVVIRGKQLFDKGFGGIHAVGQASASAPALAILSYTPAGAKINIAWVGKGIVYDTGGLSLKGRYELPRMKQDCGGAAAILGAFYAIVRSDFSENLHAIFCIAENAIGPLAVRPDDIHTLYSGKTVEINNTDAEGRIILADGVTYARRALKCDIILDMATLTGTQLIATGKYHAAVLTNNGEWESYCMQTGRTSGDLVFPVPYTPELHISEFESIFADLKNCLNHGNNASTSCAGLFIAYHLGFDYAGVWVHVDMASTVHN